LLAAEAREPYDRAARRWLGRLLEESSALTLAESDLASPNKTVVVSDDFTSGSNSKWNNQHGPG
jgi:hypothetical protein